MESTISLPVTVGRAHYCITVRSWDRCCILYDWINRRLSNKLKWIVDSWMTNNILLALVHLLHLFPCRRSFLLGLGSTLSKCILSTYVCTFRWINNRRIPNRCKAFYTLWGLTDVLRIMVIVVIIIMIRWDSVLVGNGFIIGRLTLSHSRNVTVRTCWRGSDERWMVWWWFIVRIGCWCCHGWLMLVINVLEIQRLICNDGCMDVCVLRRRGAMGEKF